MGTRERLREPEPRLAGVEADAAEDVEGDPAGGDPPARRRPGREPERAGGRAAASPPPARQSDAEPRRRRARRPRPSRPAADRGQSRAARRSAPSTRKAPGPIAGHARGAHVAVAGSPPPAAPRRFPWPRTGSGEAPSGPRGARDGRSQCSQELCQDSSRGSSSVKTCGRPPRAGRALVALSPVTRPFRRCRPA